MIRVYEIHSAPSEVRTHDLEIEILARYPLRYQGLQLPFICYSKSNTDILVPPTKRVMLEIYKSQYRQKNGFLFFSLKCLLILSVLLSLTLLVKQYIESPVPILHFSFVTKAVKILLICLRPNL